MKRRRKNYEISRGVPSINDMIRHMKRVIVFSSLFLAIAPVALAQEYVLLAPLGNTTKIASLAEYLTLIFNVTISIAGGLAVLMLVICGIKYMTSEAISAKGEAKQCVTNAILGVLLALGSWAILNTINPDLVEQDLRIVTSGYVPGTALDPTVTKVDQDLPTMPGWYFKYKETATGTIQFQRTAPERDSGDKCRQIMEQREVELAKTGGSIIPVNNEKCFLVRSQAQGVVLAAEESSARNMICGYSGTDTCTTKSLTGVYIYRRACPNIKVYQAGCTSVANLPVETINMVKNLRNLIAADTEFPGCSDVKIYITGGTEAGHSSHGEGKDPVDLRVDSKCLDAYIKKKGYITSTKVAPPRFRSTPPYPSGAPACLNKQNRYCGFQKWYLEIGGAGYWFVLELTGGNHWHVCRHKPGEKGAFCGDTLI
jgi:hypothetical protein